MVQATPTQLNSSPAYQARSIVDRARWAGSAYSNFQRANVIEVAKAVADIGAQTARKYANWAVEETGFGNADHKEIKNRLCSKGIFDHYKDHDFTSARIDFEQGIVKIPRPAGVIFALTPSTNPVCSVFFKSLLALLTRNAIVISPHPAARECCTDAANEIAFAAESAGAPDGIVQVIENPTMEVIQTVMNSQHIDVILATGGSPMVRAAYSSGNPAIGVGPGNCPVYVHCSADIEHAAKSIADSKSFDNSVLCTNESAIIADEVISVELLAELKSNGCYLCSDDERDRLTDVLFPDGVFDTAVIGQAAAWIAERARIRVPSDTRVLIAPLERIGDEYLLSREKLCPVIGYFTVSGVDAAMKASNALIRRMGSGHSAAIHSTNPQVVLRYSAELNVLRVAVNAPCSTGASGFDTNLAPTMTVGTGFFGRSSVADNVGPQHLVQWSKLAYNKDQSIDMSVYDGLKLPHATPRPTTQGDIDYSFASGLETSSTSSHLGSPDSLISDSDLRAEIHRIILEEIHSLQLVENKRY